MTKSIRCVRCKDENLEKRRREWDKRVVEERTVGYVGVYFEYALSCPNKRAWLERKCWGKGKKEREKEKGEEEER